MSRKRIFEDPNPQPRMRPITSQATTAEKRIIGIFDPVISDPVENLAGFIIRSHIDIRRYERTLQDKRVLGDAEKISHYMRLIGVTKHSLAVRTATTAEEAPRGEQSVADAIQLASQVEQDALVDFSENTVLVIREGAYGGTEVFSTIIRKEPSDPLINGV